MVECCIPTETKLHPHVAQRYVKLLGVPQAEPSYEALRALVSAHLRRVPFENISKLYRWRHGFLGVPEVGAYLDGIERFHFGGTCYANNFHLYTLLASLGYDVKLCGADMANPDVHMVIMAAVEGHEYLVDAGYAAPFLAPLPRQAREDYVVQLGRDRYVLHPQDGNGCSRLELYRNGTRQHGYLVKPAPRRLEFFTAAIAGSFRPAATFLNAALLARFYPEASVVIHNLELIESRGRGSRVSALPDRAALLAAIERYFKMPRPVVEEALASLGGWINAWN